MTEDKKVLPVILKCATPDGFIEVARLEKEYLFTVNRMQGATGIFKHLRLTPHEFDVLMELVSELQK